MGNSEEYNEIHDWLLFDNRALGSSTNSKGHSRDPKAELLLFLHNCLIQNITEKEQRGGKTIFSLEKRKSEAKYY